MPHISKRLLQKEKFIEINRQLYKVIISLAKSGHIKSLFDELLTKTEKIMLAKRLAIICLLDKRESIYAIENILKVSPSTVKKMSLMYEQNTYGLLLKEINQESSIWKNIEKIIPPRVGRNRFKNFLQF